MCNVGYLRANFGLHRPLCSRVKPDVWDRQMSDVRVRCQTDVRQKHRLMSPPIRGRGITNYRTVHNTWLDFHVYLFEMRRLYKYQYFKCDTSS